MKKRAMAILALLGIDAGCTAYFDLSGHKGAAVLLAGVIVVILTANLLIPGKKKHDDQAR